MYSTRKIEIMVGFFMLAGMLALLILALRVSGLTSYVGDGGYQIKASFDNVGDLKVRAPVTIAGVRIGQVNSIRLDRTTFKAVVTMKIDASENTIPTDSSASILTHGLLGSNYVNVTPGFDATYLKQDSEIENTHPALIFENLIGQFLFNTKDNQKDGGKK